MGGFQVRVACRCPLMVSTPATSCNSNSKFARSLSYACARSAMHLLRDPEYDQSRLQAIADYGAPG